MKLVVQIPCYNEEEFLAAAINDIPEKIAGISEIAIVVIDDGSADRTAEVAKAHPRVTKVVQLPYHQGLAVGFRAGIEASLGLSADIIVNTDADNQYNADDIPKLTAPIVARRADIVVGARPIETIEHFSLVKKLLQKLGSWVVRVASKTDIPDAPSGFRAMSRTAAQRLMVFNDYTYTLETIIQAGQKNMAITSVPIRVNKDLRPSRLVKSIPSYIQRSIVTIVRIFIIYRPFRFFATIGAVLFSIGFLIGLRFLLYYLNGEGEGHVQSLILAALLLGLGFQTLLIAVVADLLAANRKLLEEVRFKVIVLSQHENIDLGSRDNG